MKVKFLAILLMAGLMAGCSEDEPEVVQASDVQMSFNEYGDLVVKDFKPVTAANFNKYVVGSAWEEVETHQLLSDGSISQADYWDGMLGGGPQTYEFGEESVTIYFGTDVFWGGIIYFHSTLAMGYDETTANLRIGQTDEFMILSVNSDTMYAIKKGGTQVHSNGDQERVFLYVKLAKLSNAKLKEKKRIFWSDWDAIERPMKPEDLQQKWVPYDGISEITEELRSSEDRYIRFHADGTFDGKYDKSSFAGTYEYEPDAYNPDYSAATGSLKISSESVLPGDFLLLARAHHFDILGSSLLTIHVDGYQTDWYFVSGID